MLRRLLINYRGASFYLQKGISLMENRRFANAVRPLTRAKELAYRKQPSDQHFIAQIYLTRAKAYLGYGQILLAKYDLEKAKRLHPSNHEIATMLHQL